MERIENAAARGRLRKQSEAACAEAASGDVARNESAQRSTHRAHRQKGHANRINKALCALLSLVLVAGLLPIAPATALANSATAEGNLATPLATGALPGTPASATDTPSDASPSASAASIIEDATEVSGEVDISKITVGYPVKPVEGFSFDPNVHDYRLSASDAATSYTFKIAASKLPEGKTVFLQILRNGEPLLNGAALATATCTKLAAANKQYSMAAMAKYRPEVGASDVYNIVVGTKVGDVAKGAFDTIYSQYNFTISTDMPGLKTLQVKDEAGNALACSPAFASTNIYDKSYAVTIGQSASKILLSATPVTQGVAINVGGSTYSELQDQEILLADFATEDPLTYRIPIELGMNGAINTYTLTVTKKSPAPVIVSQTGNDSNYVIECDKNENKPLSVTVQEPDEGTLSYQWMLGGRAIDQATESTYTPDTSRAGSYTYKCAVTNTVNGASYTTESETITLKVNLSSVEAPEITKQPGTFTISKIINIIEGYKTEYSVGEKLDQISLGLDQPEEEGETYRYAWYSNTENSTEGGTLLKESHPASLQRLDGAYYQSFTIENQFSEGTYYLYCMVTAASESNPDLSATTVSDPVKVTFKRVQLDFTGSGLREDPYLIQSAEDFAKLRNYVDQRQYCTGVYFKMTSDITLPADWTPIGSPASADEDGANLPYFGYRVFRGILDGGNHTLTIPEGGKPLFNFVSDATICNLKIFGSKIDGFGLINSWFIDYGTDNKWNYGDPACVTIDNVTLLSGSKTRRSGFLNGSGSGINTVTIRNSTIEKNVVVGYDKSDSGIGSFVGGAFNGVIDNCTSYATVYGRNRVGGLAGSKGQTMGLCEVRNSSFRGDVIASGSTVGGIISSGYAEVQDEKTAPNSPWITIENCTVTGTVSGQNYVGGLFGYIECEQCWGNDFGSDEYSAKSSDRIVDNRFEGKIVSSGNYVGVVAGFVEALNRFTVISGNKYSISCGVNKNFGFVKYVDTSCETHETTSGTSYYDTSVALPGIPGVGSKDMNRTDDPLGADASKLACPLPYFEVGVEVVGVSAGDGAGAAGDAGAAAADDAGAGVAAGAAGGDGGAAGVAGAPVRVGDTVTVNVTVAAGAGVESGVAAAFSGTLDYDPAVFELVGVVKGAGLSEGASFLPSGSAAEAAFSFYGNEAPAADEGGIVVATATFRAIAAADGAAIGVKDGTASVAGDPTDCEVVVGRAASMDVLADALLGDANGNGRVNIVDAQAAYDMACGRYGADYEALALPASWSRATLLWAANVNGDDAIDAADAFAIQRFAHYGAWS